MGQNVSKKSPISGFFAILPSGDPPDGSVTPSSRGKLLNTCSQTCFSFTQNILDPFRADPGVKSGYRHANFQVFVNFRSVTTPGRAQMCWSTFIYLGYMMCDTFLHYSVHFGPISG